MLLSSRPALAVAVLLASFKPLLSPLASSSHCCPFGQLVPLCSFASFVIVLAISWLLGGPVLVLACQGAAHRTCPLVELVCLLVWQLNV